VVAACKKWCHNGREASRIEYRRSCSRYNFDVQVRQHLLLSSLLLIAQSGPALIFPIAIVGNERLGWEQSADNDAQLATYQYVAYIDGDQQVDLPNSLCVRPSSSATFSCSAPLPPLSPGPHTIDIAAQVQGSSVVSDRSNRLYVLVTGPLAQQLSSPRRPVSAKVTAGRAAQWRITPMYSGFEDPVDLVFASGGTLIVAERSGLVHVIRNGRRVDTPTSVFEKRTQAESLLAIAADPEFEQTHLVYAIHTSSTPEGDLAFNVVRLREVGGTFGDRVVLLDSVPASKDGASASLRFGPDGKLFVAFDDGGNPRAVSDLSSYNGKVLRLNADGTTPRDQRSSTPIYAFGHRSPRGIAWDAKGTAMWLVDQQANGGQLHVFPADGGQRAGTMPSTVPLPDDMMLAGMAMYPDMGVIEAFRGSLFIASGDSRSLLQLRIDPLASTRVVSVERTQLDTIGSVRAPAVGPDGALYVASRDTIWKLDPQGNSQ
jgi:glucose/arabinose dehydrogenase